MADHETFFYLFGLAQYLSHELPMEEFWECRDQDVNGSDVKPG